MTATLALSTFWLRTRRYSVKKSADLLWRSVLLVSTLCDLSAGVHPRVQSSSSQLAANAVTHGSRLRTFEEVFAVSALLNDAANETDLSDLFTAFP
jgi:hypothetical protein